METEAEGLERILRACRKTIEDVRGGNAKLHDDALPALERLCAELEKKLLQRTRLREKRS